MRKRDSSIEQGSHSRSVHDLPKPDCDRWGSQLMHQIKLPSHLEGRSRITVPAPGTPTRVGASASITSEETESVAS
ncbi:hypothetical protein HZH66_011427 [Vespula vulgaris]|uniref:Uncharacterized protein n=1 Tax=Vespula vulgaris TaxID=7454 RepID=A0A834MWF0_VESVU|nr:hypothetical protein HZH66_011427 [Vespula vulgaris]